MEYPKDGEYWFDRMGRIRGPLKPACDDNLVLVYLCDDDAGENYFPNGRDGYKNSDGSTDLVQRAEVTRAGPLINQNETGRT